MTSNTIGSVSTSPYNQLWRMALLLLVGILLHAVLASLLPRYEYQHVSGLGYLKIDNWTGEARIVVFEPSRP